jgi:hypothetical protein
MAVTIDGSANTITANATSATNVTNGLGIGQTWQDVSASRVAGTVYTNNTGKPIMVGIRSQGGNAILRVGSVIVARSGIDNASNYIGTVVPNGATYYLQAGAPISEWAELR